MSAGSRLALSVRAFPLAAVLGLALAFREPKVVQGTLFLVAIGGCALSLTLLAALDERWVCFVEGTLAALCIGLVLPSGAMLLPYLAAPCVMVGVLGSVAMVVTVAGIEAFALLVVMATSGSGAAIAVDLQLAAPWALASLGAGLLARWLSQLRSVPVRGDEASYEAARRLLGQLRIVARRLSSGLDAVSMATQLLDTAHDSLGLSSSALFVRTEGGVLSPLAYHGEGAQESILPEGDHLARCWAEAEPVAVGVGEPEGANRRVVLPLRSGSRMIGVLVGDGPPTGPADLAPLMASLDEQSLRLDTALVFDEVRSLATREERQRLAREIHDGIAQEIAGLGYLVDELKVDSTSATQSDRLTHLRGELSRVVGELRFSIFDLRHEIAAGDGLGSALTDYVRGVGARSGLTVHLTLDEAPTRLRGEVENELLRIAQEAVTNARKHSSAANLWVDCRVHPPFATLTVQDDGGGLLAPRPDSYGLKIMRERAERIGAALDIGSGSDTEGRSGTRVAVTVGGQPPTGCDGG